MYIYKNIYRYIYVHMALSINILWCKGFVFRHQSPILWEKTGLLHLALLGLMAGRQAGSLADKRCPDFKFLEILYK